MIKLKRKLAFGLIMMTAIFSLTGCNSKKTEEEVINYELTALDATQLQTGKIYVKDADKFYECPQGTKTFDGTEGTPSRVDKAHTIMFGNDDVLIPTLYKDQELIYVTTETPNDFIWERYEDEGYTIGVVNLDATTTNKYSLTIDPKYLLEGSSLRKAISEAGLKSGQQIIFNKISSTAITAANISPAGSVLGLTEDEAYSVDLYKGSEYISLTNILADTHVFSCFELYSSQDYNYAEADYITITVPDTLMSGYYYIYGLGFFRYVDGAVADGCAKVDFNVPYYYWDADGNEYTYDEIKLENEENNKDNEEEVDAENAEYSNTTYVDCSNESMTIQIKYNAATTTINGQTTNINDSEVGYPNATLTGPDGNTYKFTMSNQSENTLECTVQSPIMGEWITNISNISSRKFSVKTAFISGHSNSLIHTGSGKQAMTYYLPKNMNNGIFAITWENESRAATIEIKGPDGTTYNKESSNTFVYDEGYGYMKVSLGNIISGEYVVEVTGEDLGRIICTSEDLTQQD